MCCARCTEHISWRLQELQACPACKGQNWTPPSQAPHSYTQADLADPPASHFWSPDSLDIGSAADAASSGPPEASIPDLSVKTSLRRGSRSGPKTQVDCLSFRQVCQKWLSFTDWQTNLVLLALHPPIPPLLLLVVPWFFFSSSFRWSCLAFSG